ncbi:AI-2E family transporter [candidate division KSB1 bacterium]|nr:AI-2E family transporter [candidate division KSB1 bacterium]
MESTSQTTELKQILAKLLIPLAGITLFLLLFNIIKSIASLVLLLFLGILLALLFNGVSNFLSQKSRLPFGLAMIIFILIILGMLAGIGWYAGPNLIEQYKILREQIPSAINNLKDLFANRGWSEYLLPDQVKLDQIFSNGSSFVTGIAGIFSTAAGFLASLFFILFVAVYLAIDPDIYLNNLIKILAKKRRQRAKEIFSMLGNGLRWWLIGRIASMAVVGILTTVLLFIAGIHMAVFLGLIAAMFSFVPYIGPTVSAIPAIIVALSDEPAKVLYVIVIYSLVQFIESYFITPLIQERAVSMPPALLITVQVLMGLLFGLLGVLLATPLTVVLIILVQTLYVHDYHGDEIKVLGSHTK